MVRSPVKPAVHSVAEGTMRNEVIDVGLGGGPLRVAPAASTRRPEQVPARRGELDLLRALVVVGLVFFHTAVLFGAGDFPMKAATESPVATVFIAFGATWGMPLLFVVSGMGIWYSLRSRGVGAFARERVRRLLIPLLTGLVALVPLQGYLGWPRAGAPTPAVACYPPCWDVRRLGAYANEAVLPFYVLHETVIVVIAYWVLTWRIGAGAQYLLIVLSSLAATLLLYEVGVRRTRVTRLLFGLKPGRVVAARGTGDEHRQ